jgi:hypothetical protein
MPVFGRKVFTGPLPSNAVAIHVVVIYFLARKNDWGTLVHRINVENVG